MTITPEIMHAIIEWTIALASSLGYFGVFLLMTIESSFIPFPSELILIPTGVLIQRGEMSLFLVFSAALIGSILGALINYYLALKLGRRAVKSLINKYGSFFLLSDKTVSKSDSFFQKHGSIATLTGRLLPGIRQIVSLPAGFSKMHLGKFVFYTGLGAGLWALVLIYLGILFGENQALIEQNLFLASLIVAAFVLAVILIYLLINKKSS